MMTIGRRMEETRGRTTGFDYLRITLAASIILWHAIIVSYGHTTEAVVWGQVPGMAMKHVLPMFFALSGFLVAGSIDRCPTLVTFYGLRLLRIVPALAVEITISALLLGPAFTALPLADYFSDPLLPRYFRNLFGDIQYLLPGLFLDNPHPRIVNAQLWTVPSELHCYLALGGLAVGAILRSRRMLLAITAIAQLLWIVQAFKITGTAQDIPRSATGEVLLICFMAGILLHLYRDRVPLNWPCFAASAALCIGLSALNVGAFCMAFPAAYLTVFLGLLNPASNAFLRSGDYSYGLYLYGYPIQQAVAAYGPPARHFWISVGIALPAALIIAVVSWHYVERPALSLRRTLPHVERWIQQSLMLRAKGIASPSSKPAWLGWLEASLAVAGTGLLVNGTNGPGIYVLALALAVAAGEYLIWPQRTETGVSQPGLPRSSA